MNSKFEGGNDQELIRHAQAGSLAAFEQLVYRYEKRIYAFVRVSCANGEDAQEITQDTFVRAFEAIARFDRAREFAPWLFTIARRKCIDRYRSAPPQTEELTLELHLVDNPAESVAGSEESSNLWEFARRLLPTVQFQAVWLN